MDVADIILSTAKCFKYAKFQKTCDAMFVLFLGVWLYSRHYMYYRIVESIWKDLPMLKEMRWDPANGYFISYRTKYFFLVLFGILQVLLLFWLYLIIRVAYRVVAGVGAADNRSDDDDSDAEYVLLHNFFRRVK
jgi:acyl-CoA-dependent ceramide synthase